MQEFQPGAGGLRFSWPQSRGAGARARGPGAIEIQRFKFTTLVIGFNPASSFPASAWGPSDWLSMSSTIFYSFGRNGDEGLEDGELEGVLVTPLFIAPLSYVLEQVAVIHRVSPLPIVNTVRARQGPREVPSQTSQSRKPSTYFIWL